MFKKFHNKKLGGCAWVVKHLTPGFSLGHDLMVHEFKPHIGPCTDSVEPTWDSLPLSLSLSLFLPLLLMLSLSLSLSK